MIKFKFPDNFLWGSASSAFQIEAACDEDGKGPTIWDFYSRKYPEKFYKEATPDMAADFYHRYPEDISMMKELGLKSFRFSISWARIIPDGIGKINSKGIDFYNKLIDTLLENGIEPMFDLFHADLPMAIIDMGGMKNNNFVDWFARYAEICFENFGDRVKIWSTVNEPILSAFYSYAKGFGPPFENDMKGGLKASHNMILAHYKAVKIYHSMRLGGKIGAVIHFLPIYSKTLSPEDDGAAERMGDMYVNWWLRPFFKSEYPQSILEYPEISENMPENFREQLKEQFEPLDFIGINYYDAKYAIYKAGAELDYEEEELETIKDDYGFHFYPQALFDAMMYLKDNYDNPEIYITENGIAKDGSGDEEKDLDDGYRIYHMREHIREIARSIKAGANIKGYYNWSIMDTFEAMCGGYKSKFGLVQINFATLKRTPRKSWYFYQNVIRNNSVN